MYLCISSLTSSTTACFTVYHIYIYLQANMHFSVYETCISGRYCSNLVDTDRAELAREKGYHVTLCTLHPPSCTPKNSLLIGTPQGKVIM